MESFPTLLALLAIQAPAPGPGISAELRPRTATTILDLGRNAIRFDVTAGVVAFLVPESIPGEPDLNGDGDRQDWVLQVGDPRTGSVTNLALAAELWLAADGTRVAFAVDEAKQGADRNGDGDAQDDVLHVHDAATGTTTNLGLAVNSFDLRGDWLAAGVWETGQGGTDLDGDGDAADEVLHVVDLPGASVRSLGLATGTGTYALGRTTVALLVPELSQGRTDLNGDGDATDFVLHTAEIASGATTNHGLAGVPFQGLRYDEPALAIRVSEAGQGTDLDGDGDLLDTVLHVGVVPGGSLANLRLPAEDLVLRRHRATFLVPESELGGRDLNGDGDAGDRVLFLGDVAGAAAADSRVAGRNAAFAGQHVVFLAGESEQGMDLDGDGDLADLVVHVRDPQGGPARSLGLAASGFVSNGRYVAIRVPEHAQGGADLNGDGDAVDTVLHLHDLRTGTTYDLGFAVPAGTGADEPDLEIDDRRLAFLRDETGEGRDLNGDGDASDAVVHLLDLGLGETENLGLASPRSGIPPALVMRDGFLLFRVQESSQGGTDLNGDGDAGDEILHLAIPAKP